MRVVVDLDLCGGFGVCQSEAPEVFRVVDDGGYAHVGVVLAGPPPPLRSKPKPFTQSTPPALRSEGVDCWAKASLYGAAAARHYKESGKTKKQNQRGRNGREEEGTKGKA